MTVTGIERLVYGVEDIDRSSRFFADFGLRLEVRSEEQTIFRLPEGSSLEIRHRDDRSLPRSLIQGDGVREVIWGVDSRSSLAALEARISDECTISARGEEGISFLAPFGVAMGLQVFNRKPIVCAPDPLNAPGHVRRLNQHRKWRMRAVPKGIAHVVFAVPDYEAAATFMRRRLGFRLSDDQAGIGKYLRADGTNNHHNLLLLNASAPFPDLDGQLRFHHANFVVEDIDEIMVGANHMVRQGWEPSHIGLGRHRVDSALFYYLPCPAGGEAEYGADGDCVDDSWVPRHWPVPLFAYAHFAHNLPPFLEEQPDWKFTYLTDEQP